MRAIAANKLSATWPNLTGAQVTAIRDIMNTADGVPGWRGRLMTATENFLTPEGEEKQPLTPMNAIAKLIPDAQGVHTYGDLTYIHMDNPTAPTIAMTSKRNYRVTTVADCNKS